MKINARRSPHRRIRKSKHDRSRGFYPTTVACLIVAGTAIIASVNHPAIAGWELVFEDNFDGASLDRTTWHTRYIYNQGTMDRLKDEQQVYRDGDHHRVLDGVLNLVATKVHNDGRRIAYESGMIRSRKTFRYGYFEARVKLPSGKGLWPAFWLNSDYDKKGRLSWPPEIDIFEYPVNGETEQPDMIHANVAVSNTKAQDGSWIYSDKNFNRRWSYYKAPFDMSKDWHTYGLLWEPERVTVFIDGKKLFEKRYLWVYEDGAEAGPAHIIFNLAVGGPWAGKNGIDDSVFPAKLQVDYVRVCQRSESSPAAHCAGSKFTPQ